jgi:NADP-dependent 3-hydroxy acid dehydrogenase YdfG
MEIANKVVLITGASGGIGAAVARAMMQAGAAEVLLLARNEAGLQAVADAIIAGGGKARTYAADLTDLPSLDAVVQRIVADAGVPDILINNAGSGQWKSLTESTDDELQQLMTMPYLGAAWLTRRVLPGMLARNSGHIVNMSSVASRMAWPGATGYIAACRALRGFSDALRADLYRTGICVTHYESGPVDSPYWRNNPGSRERVPGIARLLLPVLTEKQVAGAVVAGIAGNRHMIVAPTMLRLVYLLHSLLPAVVQWLMTATGHRRTR